MSALTRVIQYVRDAAAAPDPQLQSFAFGIDSLPRLMPSEAGMCAVLIASSAKHLVRQLYQATPEARLRLRSALEHLGDALELEGAAHAPKPYYADPER